MKRAITPLQRRQGWIGYTPVQSGEAGAVAGLPRKVGREEAEVAARWLRDRLGEPPDVAVVLGSGLSFAHEEPPVVMVPYQDVPHWAVGAVEGHPYTLGLVAFEGRQLVILQGRIHEYEGFDPTEVQLPVRSLGAWGVQKIVLTSASGAVNDDGNESGVVVATTVLDLHRLRPDGKPEEVPATSRALVDALLRSAGGSPGVSEGLHASVPGPQYETAAELEVLKQAGVRTVSMSPASELRAAGEVGLEVAVLLVVTNAGCTSHEDVLKSSGAARDQLTKPLAILARLWS